MEAGLEIDEIESIEFIREISDPEIGSDGEVAISGEGAGGAGEGGAGEGGGADGGVARESDEIRRQRSRLEDLFES